MEYTKHRYDTAGVYPTNAMKDKEGKIQKESKWANIFRKERERKK